MADPTLPPIQNPKHTDVVAQTIQAAKASVPVAEPASVLSYDRTTQRATVQPCLRVYLRTDEGTGLESREQSPIPNVPVVWPSCSSGALVGDLVAGDMVWLVVGGRSIMEWKSTGNALIRQQDPHRHELEDAVALPMSPLALDPEAFAAGAFVISGSDVRLGSSAATSPVALSVPTDADFSALWTLLGAIAGAANFPAAQTAIALFLASHPTPTPTGATRVKAL